jgi:hypothetical protein
LWISHSARLSASRRLVDHRHLNPLPAHPGTVAARQATCPLMHRFPDQCQQVSLPPFRSVPTDTE